MKKHKYDRKDYYREYYSKHREAWKNKYVFGRRFETISKNESLDIDRHSKSVMNFINKRQENEA